MTKEEAIRILKNFSLCGVYHQLIHMNDTDSEAISMAIKALEQPEPCEDAISRQAVFDEAFEVDTKEYGRIDVVGVDAIVALPPVTPQPKTGHLREQARWVPCSERLPDDLSEVNVTWVNHNPVSYYEFVKDKPFSATAVYYKGKWYWWTQYTQDLLAEYGERCNVGLLDKDVEITAWMPLPEAYGGEQ